MALAQSRLSAQGQISVPAEVRKRLGIRPGSVIEWELDGEKVVVRRANKYAVQDTHSALFPKGPPARKTTKSCAKGYGCTCERSMRAPSDSDCDRDDRKLESRQSQPMRSVESTRSSTRTSYVGGCPF
jgi:antitoxin PrlF